MLKINKLLIITLFLTINTLNLFGSEFEISNACLQAIKQNCPYLDPDKEYDPEFLKILGANSLALKLCNILHCINQPL